MKSTLEKSAVLKLVRAADRRLGKKQKTAFPVRLICNGHALVLWHNREHGYAVQIDAETTGADEIAVTAAPQEILAAIRNYTGKSIDVEPSAISCGPFRRSLGRLEYVAPPSADDEKEKPTSARIDAAQLAAAIRLAMEAIDQSPQYRYRLDCVRIEHDAAVATDGRRLIVADIDTDAGEEFVAMLDYTAAETLLDCLPKSGTVTIDATPLRTEIRWEGGQFWHRVPEGRFPRWRDIVSGTGQRRFYTVLDAAQLAAGIKTTSSVRTEETRRTSARCDGATLHLSANTSAGDAAAMIDTKRDFGNVWEFCADLELIRKILPKSGAVTIDAGNEPGKSAILIETDGVSAVIIPMAKL